MDAEEAAGQPGTPCQPTDGAWKAPGERINSHQKGGESWSRADDPTRWPTSTGEPPGMRPGEPAEKPPEGGDAPPKGDGEEDAQR